MARAPVNVMVMPGAAYRLAAGGVGIMMSRRNSLTMSAALAGLAKVASSCHAKFSCECNAISNYQVITPTLASFATLRHVSIWLLIS